MEFLTSSLCSNPQGLQSIKRVRRPSLASPHHHRSEFLPRASGFDEHANRIRSRAAVSMRRSLSVSSRRAGPLAAGPLPTRQILVAVERVRVADHACGGGPPPWSGPRMPSSARRSSGGAGSTLRRRQPPRLVEQPPLDVCQEGYQPFRLSASLGAFTRFHPTASNRSFTSTYFCCGVH